MDENLIDAFLAAAYGVSFSSWCRNFSASIMQIEDESYRETPLYKQNYTE